VAHDGAAKIPVFHSKTITQMIEDGADMRRIALLLACFRLYCRGSDQLGIAFEVLEPQLGDADRLLLADADPLAMLEASPFAALQLNAHVAFRCQFSSLCKMIEQDGLRAALAWVIC
jgi:hypothetical protein